MNPAETAAILRQFNEWRRGDEDIPQFDPRDIGEAIDAAVEMIDRLEAAERERDAAELMSLALRAKIAEMERQKPIGWLFDGDFYEVRQMSLYKDNEPLQGQTALYALPGAQPATNVPDGWKEAAIAWEVCASIHREYGKGKDPFFNTRQGDFVKHANDARAMLAAAPEAK